MCEGDFEMATATEIDEYETESGIILGGDDLVNLNGNNKDTREESTG